MKKILSLLITVCFLFSNQSSNCSSRRNGPPSSLHHHATPPLKHSALPKVAVQVMLNDNQHNQKRLQELRLQLQNAHLEKNNAQDKVNRLKNLYRKSAEALSIIENKIIKLEGAIEERKIH